MELYIGVIISVILTVISSWIIYRKRRFSLFERYGIPGPKPNIWSGNLNEFIEKRENCTSEWMKKYGKFVGFYYGAKPMLIACDPAFLKIMQVKEFQNFANKDLILPEPFPNKLIKKFVELQNDEEWKNVRSCLTSALSSGKIKRIFPIVAHCVTVFMKNVENQKGQPFDILNFFKKLTFDTTSKASFGVATNVQNNETNKFIESVYNVFESDVSEVLATICVCFPEFEPLPTRLRSIVDSCKYLMNKNSIRFLISTCSKIIRSRKEMKSSPNDVLQCMIEANEAGDDSSRSGPETEGVDPGSTRKLHKLSDEEVLANAVGFMAAGYDTTSGTLGYCAYLLSKNQEVQEKVRKEIKKYLKAEEEMDYSILANLQYMEQVISETLRLFPLTLPVINRICKADFKYHGMTVPKGAVVVVPVWTLHRDPAYWAEPEKFMPERFSPENRHTIDSFVYQPFGAGPRICIGMRLSISIMKWTLTSLLKSYRLEACDADKELELEHTLFFIKAKNGIHVRAIPISD